MIYLFILIKIELSVAKTEDLFSKEELSKTIRAAISAKQIGYEDLLSDLVVEAALNIMPKNPKDFNVDSVRVVKVMGSSIHESRVVKGMVFGREPEGKEIVIIIIIIKMG